MSRITEIIEQINQKQNVLSDKAINAKFEYDSVKHQLTSAKSPEEILNNDELDDVSNQLHELKQILQNAHIDELTDYLANPHRMIITSFFNSMAKGIGFSIGIISTGLVFVYASLSLLTPEMLKWIFNFLVG